MHGSSFAHAMEDGSVEFFRVPTVVNKVEVDARREHRAREKAEKEPAERAEKHAVQVEFVASVSMPTFAPSAMPAPDVVPPSQWGGASR